MRTLYFLFGLILIFIFSCKKDSEKKIIDILGQKEASNTEFKNIPVNSIVVDVTGAKWIGTDSGLFLYKGEKYWEGSRNEIMNATNQQLNDFIFAGRFFREIKDQNTKRLSDEKNK